MHSADENRIIWQRLDMPGHEASWVLADEDGWVLDGSAVFLYERTPCRLEYFIECDEDWRTATTSISGWVGEEVIDLEIEADPGECWTINGHAVPEAEGCLDIDLNFSPSTNLLPIRRLNLAIGQTANVRAAWLRFPSFKLEPLEQIYTRLSENIYRYESADGSFVREIEVNRFGLVINYPDFWLAVS